MYQIVDSRELNWNKLANWNNIKKHSFLNWDFTSSELEQYEGTDLFPIRGFTCTIIVSYPQVKTAEKYGAIGVILYSDPQDYAAYGTNVTAHCCYPDTIMMPNSAVPHGTAYLYDGDPLTPFYPSVGKCGTIILE